MKATDLEHKVRRIISAVKTGQPVEDTLIELKSEWSKDSHRAARRIAAHANAAHGESITWVFGVDEKGKIVTGVDEIEMANWVQSVGKHFDGLAPALITHTNIRIEDKTIVALHFETSRSAPFVIKNGQNLEVPWREGTLTRSAKREELLSILLPIVKTPNIEIRSAELNFGVRRGSHITSLGGHSEESHAWTIKATLYIEPKRPETIFIPHKNCRARFEVSDYPAQWEIPVTFKPAGESLTVRCSATELVVDGPGSIVLESEAILPPTPETQNSLAKGSAKIIIKIQSLHTNKSIKLERKLIRVEKDVISNFFSGGSKWIG